MAGPLNIGSSQAKGCGLRHVSTRDQERTKFDFEKEISE
jgi:hypothetical protein